MTLADDAKTILAADSGAGGAAALLTGGIYTFAETKRLGVNPKTTSDAFDSNGLMKPTLVIKDRSQVADSGVTDDLTQRMSYRQIVEFWVYDDGDSTNITLEAVIARIFTKLHGVQVGASKIKLRWAETIYIPRDAVQDNALLVRIDYEARAVQA
jgi:hypothetical protein